MSLLRPASLAAAILVVAACAANQAPVPVVGHADDLASLAGEWSGEYSSTESGRSGSISFTLRSATDSAFGEVVMIPAGWGRPLAPWRGETTPSAVQRPMSEVLTINFVRVEAGRVNGTLAPYADPQTGARLLTTFAGQLSGNTITGTYITRMASGETQAGRWTVQRK
jgi:hypothetical protein